MAPRRGLAAALLACACAVSAAQESSGSINVGADGTLKSAIKFDAPVVGGKKKKARGAAGTVLLDGPAILAPNSVVQLPANVDPRSFGYLATRRAIAVTDGAVHVNAHAMRQGVLGSFMNMFSLSAAGRPYPNAYIIAPNGTLVNRMDMAGRIALPYGVAEAPDGRIAFTFYNQQRDSIEVWEQNLATKFTYHDMSLKPSVPVYYGGNLWVPFTVADRLNEEGNGIILVQVYDAAGARVEVFPRRCFSHVKMVHSIAVDAHMRMFAAGIVAWAWDDGTFGQVPRATQNLPAEAQASPLRIDVYQVSTDKRTPAWRAELMARWRENNPHREPTPQQLSELKLKYALVPLKSYPFPGFCVWPLMALAPDGMHLIVACYDSAVVTVLRVADDAGAGNAPTLRDEAFEVSTFQAPAGITRVGAISFDPTGKAWGVLDRERKRVYSFAWPLDAAAVRNARDADFVFSSVPNITYPDS